MTCASCAAASPTTAGTADRLDAVLASFWPPGVPFPPMAPYVAAVVSRSDLRQWALDIGADKDAGVLAKDPTAILSLLGQAMSDPSLVYAAARKKRKGKKPDEHPCEASCRSTACYDCNGCDLVAWSSCSDGFCSYRCTWGDPLGGAEVPDVTGV